MNSERIFCSILAFAVAMWAGEAQAAQPLSSPQFTAQPVFLLSERELGAGLKVCFLSNGLQMRLPSEKVCPYPLKAPPLVTEPAPASSALAENNNSVALEPPKRIEQPKLQTSTLPSPPAAAPNAVVKLPEQPKSKPAAQQAILQPTPQTGAAPRAVNVSNKNQASGEGNSIENRDVIEDEIADKAIRRCERIGFKIGTEPFKVCALEQIKILSEYKN